MMCIKYMKITGDPFINYILRVLSRRILGSEVLHAYQLHLNDCLYLISLPHGAMPHCGGFE